MFRRSRAFTLAELLTVLAIIALVAGLLFPVFVTVKVAAKRTQCLSNMHQAQLATEQYLGDYDDFFMPVNHRPGMAPNPRLDRTWVQLVLPYTNRNFTIFRCPADSTFTDESDATFDQDLVPGDIYAQYYTASMHVNMGFNYLYLSPIVKKQGQWVSEPRSTSMVGDPSKTLLFADSIWDRLADGTPTEGGNWLVVPPCRWATPSAGTRPFDSFTLDATEFYTPVAGWKVGQPNSPHIYGNAWPWHSGRVNLVRVDGSAKSWPIGKLSAGCDVQDGWKGLIGNSDQYSWGGDFH